MEDQETTVGEHETESSGFEPITSQDALDKIIGARLGRVQQKFSDYDDLKTKAAQFDELEQANKSELQRERERAEAAEQRANAADQIALHARIAAETGVPVETIKGDDEESARACAQKILEWRDSNIPKKKAPSAGGLKSGASGPGDQVTGKERAAAALRQMRTGD